MSKVLRTTAFAGAVLLSGIFSQAHGEPDAQTSQPKFSIQSLRKPVDIDLTWKNLVGLGALGLALSFSPKAIQSPSRKRRLSERQRSPR